MVRCAWPLLALLMAGDVGAQAPPRSNFFGDPFVQITERMAACPIPAGPLYTAQEVREEEHIRSQKGVSCYMAGRCRLPNAYLYDKEIVPRVAIAVHADGRFEDTSIWALGQRRLVYLKGCVQTEQQSRDLEALVGRIDDVEGVVNQLMTGTRGKASYELAGPAR
jgi:hypothetical protein